MVLIRNVSVPGVCILHIRALGTGTRYSNVKASMLPEPTLTAEANVTHWLVIPLLNQPSGGHNFQNSCSLSPVAV